MPTRKGGMYCEPGSEVEPSCRNYVRRYVSVVLFDSNIIFDQVSEIYFITDCSIINPVIVARTLPPQKLANPAHPGTKSLILNFDP